MRRNLTNDGSRASTYDDENQLTSVSVANSWKSEFVYDGLGRRRIRPEYTWNGSWSKTNEVRYIYDGSLTIQERDANNYVRVTYTRGIDLSGRFQGAGGIGGLLARTDANGTAFYHADGNGNVTALVNGSQAVAAKYCYDPYGNLVSQSGSLADANLYRFSSKELHANSGLCYHTFRHYDPNLQRWLNRDPIMELGGINLYRFVHNSPQNFADPFGMSGVGLAPAEMISQAEINALVAEGEALLAEEALLGFIADTGAAGATFAGAYMLGDYIGEQSGFHDWLADKITPNDYDSSPLPMPGGSMQPPRKPPTTKTSAPCPGGNGRGGENEHTARGREAHKWHSYPDGFRTDFSFENGLRPDAINFKTQEILELKPDNPRAIAEGLKQVQTYLQQATKEFGGKWTGRVVTY